LSLDSPYDTIAPTTIFFNSKENKALSILTKNKLQRKKERKKSQKKKENKKTHL
jgi:rRNA processing protein Gar1